MTQTKTLPLIVVVLILGIVGITLLKLGTKSEDTGSQGSADVTQPDEPETPEEEPEEEPAADRFGLIRARAGESLRTYLGFVLGIALLTFSSYSYLMSSPESVRALGFLIHIF